MKRIIPWVCTLSILFLVSCNLPSTGRSNAPASVSTATLSPAQIQTEISAMLTVMPSATAVVPGAPAGSPTVGLPTVSVDQASPTAEVSQPTQEAPAAATSTPEAQAALPTSTTTPTLAPAAATATSTPPGPTATLLPGDPRQSLGAPTSTDPMNNSTTWVWPTGSDQYTSATFSNGYQVITSLHKDDGWRMANPTGTSFTNTYIEATFNTTTCSGSDHYGIILRVPVVNAPDQGYLFGVTCDGRYALRRWNGEVQPKGEMKRLVDLTASSAIKTGSNQTNRLGIYAVVSRLIMYVNGTLLTEVSDSLYPSGYFGVFVGADVTQNLTVQVDEMSYWLNPQP